MVVPWVHLLSDTLLMQHTYHASGDSTAVCLINASDEDVVLAAESTVGRAVEAALHEPVPFLSRAVRTLAEAAPPQEVPAHLQDLLERSSEELTGEQRSQLAELLTEFQDVFARSEFDFGDFTALVHEIDTGDAPPPPVKEKMRRTPAFFAGEEEAHLNKMLDAGDIQPSISEWASAPELIRKKDGQVRWCLDYRRLNNVTRKDVFHCPL